MKIFIKTIFIALSVSILTTNCGLSEKKRETPNTVVDSVTVLKLVKVPVVKKLTIPAELIPIERAEIYSKINGYIKELKVDIGDEVRKGDVMVIIDAPELISAYAQANAEVRTAYSRNLSSADRYKRITNASKVAGTVAAGELESAKNQMSADSSAYAAAKAKLDASSQLKDYLVIRAPFDGIVTQRNADRGTLTGSNIAKPVLVIEKVDILRLRIPVPEIYTSAISDTSVVEFTVDAKPGKNYMAALSRKSGSINLSNRTETWEYTCQNRDKTLKPGMVASARINLGRNELSFLVPSSAIATTLEKKFVIRLKNGLAEWVDVKTGFNQNDKIEIFGELLEGDLLLNSATDEIKPGTKLAARATKN